MIDEDPRNWFLKALKQTVLIFVIAAVITAIVFLTLNVPEEVEEVIESARTFLVPSEMLQKE